MGERTHRVVVVGGGFGGLQALRLRRAPVEVTLVDRRNFHLFQPLTYQVATGALSPGGDRLSAARDLQAAPQRPRPAGGGPDFDLDGARGPAAPGRRRPAPAAIAYDTLIVAAGRATRTSATTDWASTRSEVKSLESALAVRSRLLSAFEAAEVEPDPERRRAWLTFVVVGAGPTGVEMAGQIGELARDTLRRDFRSDRPAHGAHPARGGGRSRAHDVSAVAVGEGRAVARASSA